MKKRILFAVLGLVVIIAVLGGIKALQIRTMIEQGKKFVPPAETVTTTQIKAESWETALTAVGTLNAVKGVTVAAELAGKVANIAFEPGTAVKKGELLLKQDTSSEEAQLPGAIAQVKLVRANLKRADQLLAEGIIAQADHDTAVANADQAQAQADNIRATIAKKTIRAPFSGRLGISLTDEPHKPNTINVHLVIFNRQTIKEKQSCRSRPENLCAVYPKALIEASIRI